MGKKYALFIGRWQPLHFGHTYIIDRTLEEGKDVLIAIRDTEVSPDNPYSAYERRWMIESYYNEKYPGRVETIIIPDIESINVGRKVGYEINLYDGPKEVEDISATSIRESIRNRDDKWREYVPDAVADVLDILHDENIIYRYYCSPAGGYHVW